MIVTLSAAEKDLLMCLEDGARLVAGGTERAARGTQVVSAVDHHLHIQSAAATAEMRNVARRLPDIFSRLNPALLEERGGGDALRQLDDAGIGQGVLLSEGYIFTSPFATPGMEHADALTRQENQFNVAAALGSGARLKAFVGINPFCSFALDELAYWDGREGVCGVKLHLGNSGFDPTSDQQVEMLADFVEQAAAIGLPILVHARHAGPYQPADTERFIDRVLRRAEGITVQIAHGGGGGGAGEAVEALSCYAGAIERGARGISKLIIDLSCVLVLDPACPQNAALLECFVRDARRIGIGRFVMGSDWPTLCTPREHDVLIASQLPFTAEEWGVIAANRAAYLD